MGSLRGAEWACFYFLHKKVIFGFLKGRDAVCRGHFEEDRGDEVALNHLPKEFKVEIPAFLPHDVFVALNELLDPLLDADLDVTVELEVLVLDAGKQGDELAVEFVPERHGIILLKLCRPAPASIINIEKDLNEPHPAVGNALRRPNQRNPWHRRGPTRPLQPEMVSRRTRKVLRARRRHQRRTRLSCRYRQAP